MRALKPLPIESDYQSMPDVIEALSTLEQVFHEARDRRAIFASAYLTLTQELKRHVDMDWFQDSAWVARYAVAFANLYRKALWAFECGDWASLPKAWSISLHTSSSGTGLLIQDLVLQ